MVSGCGWFGGGRSRRAGIREWEVRVSQEGVMVMLLGVVMGKQRVGVLVILVVVQRRSWSVVERL